MNDLKLEAEWTDDCSGKKDYDGDIITLSTRYWPQGGGFGLLDLKSPDKGVQGNETRPHIRPSAKAEILLHHSAHEFTPLAMQRFEGDTEDEVKAAVEAWAQSKFEKIVYLLRGEL